MSKIDRKKKKAGVQAYANGSQQTNFENSNADVQVRTDVTLQSDTEKTGADKEEKSKNFAKFMRDLIDELASKFGYVKRDNVSWWFAMINKAIAEDMNDNEFAVLSLNAKFEVLKDSIERMKTAQVLALERTNAAADTAKAQVEAEVVAKGVAEKRAVVAEERAAAAEELSNKLTALLQEQGSKFQSDDIQLLKSENNDLCKELDTYKNDLKEAREKNLQLNVAKYNLDGKLKMLQQEHAELQTERDNFKTDLHKLQAEHDSLQMTYNTCKARCEELEAGDVAQLEIVINEKDGEINRLNETTAKAETARNLAEEAKKAVDSLLEDTKRQLDEARETIKTREGELKDERNTTKDLRQTIKACEKDIKTLNNQVSKYAAEIESQKMELDARQATINEKAADIIKLNDDNDSLRLEIEVLNNTVSGLEQDKVNLTAANKTAKQQLDEKTDFIRAERDVFAKTMMSLAKSLSEASANDFLGCCDDAFESNRVSLQEKVLKPVRALEREMSELRPENYVSREELAAAYHILIKSQLDEASGLTRIAQWYAYSQVAFMVDEDRADGLFIRQQEIKNIYTLAVRLMSQVGLEYSLPALYSERLSKNNAYEDVTGRRQLNIEYMCPTARSHKENIDCVDNSQVIIDVVEVGYTDIKGNNKKSQVII